MHGAMLIKGPWLSRGNRQNRLAEVDGQWPWPLDPAEQGQDDQEMAEVVGGRHLSDWNEDPFRRLTADIAQHEITHDQQLIVE